MLLPGHERVSPYGQIHPLARYVPPIVLRCRYAMSGTSTRHASYAHSCRTGCRATRALCDVRYRARLCDVRYRARLCCYTTNSNTRNRVPGTVCAENVVACI
eukprot:2033321-Rhodomonas_salina.1